MKTPICTVMILIPGLFSFKTDTKLTEEQTGCGNEISMDCWQEMMDEASAKDFRDLSVKTTCCHTLTDLNALKYQAVCGFAKSVITVIDPDTMSNDSKLLPELKKNQRD